MTGLINRKFGVDTSSPEREAIQRRRSRHTFVFIQSKSSGELNFLQLRSPYTPDSETGIGETIQTSDQLGTLDIQSGKCSACAGAKDEHGGYAVTYLLLSLCLMSILHSFFKMKHDLRLLFTSKYA